MIINNRNRIINNNRSRVIKNKHRLGLKLIKIIEYQNRRWNKIIEYQNSRLNKIIANN